MAVLASSLIDWSALWKIIVAALIGGVGVVVVFGFLLLALKHANAAKSEGGRLANYALSGVCGVLCVGAVVVGIYATAKKPSSKPKPKAKSAALIVHPATPRQLIASAP